MSTNKQKFKALFLSYEGVGHINACVGVAQVLLSADYSVTFAVSEQWRGRLESYGIQEIILNPLDANPAPTTSAHTSPAKTLAKSKMKDGLMSADSGPINYITKLWQVTMPKLIAMEKHLDKQLVQVIDNLRPDVIFLDRVITLPTVNLSGIPWVNVCSGNPLVWIDDQRTPPTLSGLPLNGDQSVWKAFRKTYNDLKQDIKNNFNKYLLDNNLDKLNDTTPWLMNDSPYLNIYGYPHELDYTHIRPLPPNWVGFDNLKRTEKLLPFQIPDKLENKQGKLVYFSLGSMGAADVVNMKRLVGILSKSQHRFIVSKGPLHDQFDLADNMWGDEYVPQMQVLPLVHLVITHGGNNTITETFYFGKPLIVMPLMSDQYDNAQRVEDQGFGKRLDAYKCSEDELLITIESLLNNNDLSLKLAQIAKRIQSENNITKLPKMIQNIIDNTKN